MNSLTSGIGQRKARWRRLSNTSMGFHVLGCTKLFVSAAIINYTHPSLLPFANQTEDKI